MAVSATPEKVKAPYFHQSWPKWVHSAKGAKLFDTQADFEEQLQEDGPGVWFDSPAKVPAPPKPPEIDFKAEIAALKAEVTRLREVNGDLVARHIAKAKTDK